MYEETGAGILERFGMLDREQGRCLPAEAVLWCRRGVVGGREIGAEEERNAERENICRPTTRPFGDEARSRVVGRGVLVQKDSQRPSECASDPAGTATAIDEQAWIKACESKKISKNS